MTDKNLFMKLINYTEKNYKIDSSSYSNNSFLVHYSDGELQRMINDNILYSQLTNQKWLTGYYNFFQSRGLNQLKLIDSLIKIELKWTLLNVIQQMLKIFTQNSSWRIITCKESSVIYLRWLFTVRVARQEICVPVLYMLHSF